MFHSLSPTHLFTKIFKVKSSSFPFRFVSRLSRKSADVKSISSPLIQVWGKLFCRYFLDSAEPFSLPGVSRLWRVGGGNTRTHPHCWRMHDKCVIYVECESIFIDETENRKAFWHWRRKSIINARSMPLCCSPSDCRDSNVAHKEIFYR